MATTHATTALQHGQPIPTFSDWERNMDLYSLDIIEDQFLEFIDDGGRPYEVLVDVIVKVRYQGEVIEDRNGDGSVHSYPEVDMVWVRDENHRNITAEAHRRSLQPQIRQIINDWIDTCEDLAVNGGIENECFTITPYYLGVTSC